MGEQAVYITTIVLALAYAYSNGINDAANAIATVVSTRVLRPMVAVAMGASMNLVGALTVFFFLGPKVAETIGKGIVEPDVINQYTVMAAIGASVLWVLSATRLGFPVSVSHSLVASIVGAGLATAGIAAIEKAGFIKVVVALAVSPLTGFILAFVVMLGLYWLVHGFSPQRLRGTFRRRPGLYRLFSLSGHGPISGTLGRLRILPRLIQGASPGVVRTVFGRLQILSAVFLAYSHGRNDGQNAIGIIALAAAVRYKQPFSIELWMILLPSLAIGLGTALGGWRVIRTLGLRITKLETIHGFAASTSAASVIEAASFMGLPVSTTHTISGSIMGVGATRRFSAVRWGVTRSIALAWLVTYPVCFALAWVLSTLFETVLVTP